MGDLRFRGGHPPFGYARDGEGALRIVRREAAAVRRLFREYARRGSLARLADLAKTLGGGRRFSRAGLAWILRNPVYRGVVRDGRRARPGRHPPIIPEADFQRVQALLSARQRRRKRKEKGVAHATVAIRLDAPPPAAWAEGAEGAGGAGRTVQNARA